jgi:protein-tyrosine phosphatase
MNVLMVCLGNICRSPLAHGILEEKIKLAKLPWTVDSAGTSGWHNGERPDSRSIEVARQNNINISNQSSRKFIVNDFDDFDLILAMDSANYRDILNLARNEDDKLKVKLILNFSFPGENRAVPDPYYEGGFDGVYNMLERACEEIILRYQ